MNPRVGPKWMVLIQVKRFRGYVAFESSNVTTKPTTQFNGAKSDTSTHNKLHFPS